MGRLDLVAAVVRRGAALLCRASRVGSANLSEKALAARTNSRSRRGDRLLGENAEILASANLKPSDLRTFGGLAAIHLTEVLPHQLVSRIIYQFLNSCSFAFSRGNKASASMISSPGAGVLIVSVTSVLTG
jgi:hypothetical protein